jgi:hypothetical protein
MADFVFRNLIDETERVEVRVKVDPSWDKDSFFPDPVMWCCANFGKCQHSKSSLTWTFYFDKREDAMMFKLAWGGDIG